MAETRAARMKAIRLALGETQRQFADRMTAAAAALGFGHEYTENNIGKMELEYRDTNLADVAVIEEIDPEHRGWFWFAFGRERPARARKRGERVPDPDAKEAGAGKKRA